MESKVKIVYTAYDLRDILGISQTAAYNLMHLKSFPSFRIGGAKKGNLVVRAADLDKWIEAQIEAKRKKK